MQDGSGSTDLGENVFGMSIYDRSAINNDCHLYPILIHLCLYCMQGGSGSTNFREYVFCLFIYGRSTIMIDIYISSIFVFRDYLMAFWLSAKVSTRNPIISPRALARGLIMVEG